MKNTISIGKKVLCVSLTYPVNGVEINVGQPYQLAKIRVKEDVQKNDPKLGNLKFTLMPFLVTDVSVPSEEFYNHHEVLIKIRPLETIMENLDFYKIDFSGVWRNFGLGNSSGLFDEFTKNVPGDYHANPNKYPHLKGYDRFFLVEEILSRGEDGERYHDEDVTLLRNRLIDQIKRERSDFKVEHVEPYSSADTVVKYVGKIN